MDPQPKIRIRRALIGALLVAACAIALKPMSTRAESDEREVLARVNGRPIYEAQVKPELDAVLRKFRKYGMQREDAALIKRWRGKILDRIIGEQLVQQESQKLTIEDLDERVSRELSALRKKYGEGKSFEKYLKKRKLAMKDLMASLRTKVRLAAYLEKHGISEPEIPEARIREAYERNPKAYSTKEQVKVSHILIKAAGPHESAEAERARQKAERIRQEILNGGDFADLARKHSDCNSAPGGGDLRYISKGFMPTEFERVAFAMESNAVSKVVKTRFGFHIIKVFDKKPAGRMPYENVRGFIRKFLQEGESKKALTAHIAKLRGKAKIEILPKDEP